MAIKRGTPFKVLATSIVATALWAFLSTAVGISDWVATSDLVEGMNERSTAALKTRYNDLAQNTTEKMSTIKRQQESEISYTEDVNYEILNGPSDWSWFVFPHDRNFHLNSSNANPKNFIDDYNIRTVTDYLKTTSSLTLTKNGESVLHLKRRANNVDAAAEKGIILLREAYDNVRAAKQYPGTTAEGTYTLMKNGTVEFEKKNPALSLSLQRITPPS